MTRNSLWLKRIVILATIAPFALLWGEIYTRIFAPQNVDSRMNIYAVDSTIGYTYKPNATTYEKGREYNALYQINSLGLRDREYRTKQKGIFRVLLLGDSFSVSHGLSIEASLSRQLERTLQESADRDSLSVIFEVVNTAAGGYSPYNYWKAYLRWAPILHPDAVIVGLSPDDYDSSNAGFNYLIEDGDTLATFREGQTPNKTGRNNIMHIRKWLSWNSQFYILLRNFLYYNETVGRISNWLSTKSEGRIMQLQQFIVPQPEIITKARELSYSYLDKLYEATVSDKIPLIMISIPLKEEIDNSFYQLALASSGLNQNQADVCQPLKETVKYCESRNIHLFDPRPAIKARHLEVPCYFVYDGHWVAEGIRVATASMAKQWRESRIPPWDN